MRAQEWCSVPTEREQSSKTCSKDVKLAENTKKKNTKLHISGLLREYWEIVTILREYWTKRLLKEYCKITERVLGYSTRIALCFSYKIMCLFLHSLSQIMASTLSL